MWKYGTVCMKILTKQINNKGVQIKLKKKEKKKTKITTNKQNTNHVRERKIEQKRQTLN